MKTKICKNAAGGGARRDSAIELFRIITMFCIVAHHSIVNSGVSGLITQANVLEPNSLFALIFGWGGKTGINCFVLITGYYMCTSHISLRKFLKLLLEVEFYKLLFWLIFWAAGYETFSVLGFIKMLLPVYSIGTGFLGSYLVFYLFIPYLNILIEAMTERQHLILSALCVICGSVFPTLLRSPQAFTYVGWFMTLYLIASYIRLYPEAEELKAMLSRLRIRPKEDMMSDTGLWVLLMLVMLMLSWGSIVTYALVYHQLGRHSSYYFYVSDSHKLLALGTSIAAFMFFKNLKMRYHPTVNRIAASTFGVLLIHANSDAVRKWLWVDTMKQTEYFYKSSFIIHCILGVALIYIVCTLIDQVRISLMSAATRSLRKTSNHE